MHVYIWGVCVCVLMCAYVCVLECACSGQSCEVNHGWHSTSTVLIVLDRVFHRLGAYHVGKTG